MTHRPEGMVVWITGLPASGKSTLAVEVLRLLEARGTVTIWLDSDDLRQVMTPKPSYTPQERDMFYTAIGHVAALAAGGGSVAVISATASRRCYRDAARGRVTRFAEVYLKCAEHIRRARDFKGLYGKQDAGVITTLPGIGSSYEAPLDPELVLDSGKLGPADLAPLVLELIDTR